MKGKNNDKPQSKYHPYIIELLKLPIIKNVKGGGYKPENNFKLSDLDNSQLNELLKLKPEFKNSLILGKFEDGIDPNSLINSWRHDIDSLIEKAKEPELKLIFRFYKHMVKAWVSHIDNYFKENELLMLLNNETIDFIEKNHISKMGERLEIDRRIAEETSNETVQLAIIEKYKTDKNSLINPIYYLCLNNNHVSENVQQQILKSAKDIEFSAVELYWLKALSSRSEYPDILKQIVYNIEKIKKGRDDLSKTVQQEIYYIYNELRKNKNTPKEILPQVKLGFSLGFPE
jgi:hypothetical protein